MSKKISISIISFLLLTTLFVTSCSSDDKDSKKSNGESTKSEKKTGKKVSSSSSNKFIREVDAACNNSSLSIRSSNFGIDSSSSADEVIETLATIEDELDGLISDFEDIDASAKDADDWETLIDDLSHVRDLFPEFGDLLTQMQSISDSASDPSSLTPERATELQDQLLELQSQAEDITTDITQTFSEVDEISQDLGLSDCLSSR
jgi:hypothetical protein